jgi:SnoaL-like domain
VGKGAFAPCPPYRAVLVMVGTLRFAHPTKAAISDWIIDAKRDRRHRLRHHGQMGGGVQQAGRQGSCFALFAGRVLLRLNPNFYRGNDGVQAYFEGLPRWQSPSVQFTDVRTAQAAADLINVAGTATFVVEEDAEPLVVKITWVIIREDGEWRIVSHHVSSKTPLIAQ